MLDIVTCMFSSCLTAILSACVTLRSALTVMSPTNMMLCDIKQSPNKHSVCRWCTRSVSLPIVGRYAGDWAQWSAAVDQSGSPSLQVGSPVGAETPEPVDPSNMTSSSVAPTPEAAQLNVCLQAPTLPQCIAKKCSKDPSLPECIEERCSKDPSLPECPAEEKCLKDPSLPECIEERCSKDQSLADRPAEEKCL